MVDFPDKKYDIIYADPPWDYSAIWSERASHENSVNPAHHYPVMPADEIAKLPIGDIAADDCLLYLWAVNPLLPDCIAVGKAWGFNWATVAFIWDKVIPVKGHYTLSQCELCLVMKKGKIPQPRGTRNERQYIRRRKGAHSQKPIDVAEAITRMHPTQSKIELFHRADWTAPPMPGWDYWGQES